MLPVTNEFGEEQLILPFDEPVNPLPLDQKLLDIIDAWRGFHYDWMNECFPMVKGETCPP